MIYKIIKNIKTLDEYIDENGFEVRITKDDFDMDNMLISYINNSLTGYMRHYIRELNKPRYKFCCRCGILIEKINPRQKYCELCKVVVRNERQKKYMKIRRNKC